MPLWEIITLLFYLLYLAIAIYTTGVIIYRKSDPVKSLSWIVIILFLPYIGLIVYLLFGQNFRKRKIYNRKGVRDERVRRIMAKKQLNQFTANYHLLPNNLKEVDKLITLNLRGSRSLLGVNSKISLYFTGKEALEMMYQAIEEAQKHIHLQSYIIEDDLIGNKFKDILITKAKEGVEVRVIYDDVGCWSLSKEFKRSLIENGIELLNFAPVKLPSLTSKINYRNHRKILVVDGKKGFLGGVNIAERYYRESAKSTWRDTHICIEGESVSALQSSFLLDRYFIINQQLKSRKKYHPIPLSQNFELSTSQQGIYTQIITSGPDSDWADIMQSYFTAIVSAKKEIYIVTPYFTPNISILDAIKTASLGGVKVSLMLSEKSDTKIAQWSTISYATELLEAGVKVYLFRKGFNHSKVISIDGRFSIIGSANMDNRSLEHNFEVTAIVYDSTIAQEVEEQFKRDVVQCRTLESSKWAKRSVKQKIIESFARLLSPLL
ncbi:MAG: cardiolipin synthase [Bacteroidales bacterium]